MGFTVPIIWAVLVVFAGLTVLLLCLGLFQDRSRGRPRCPKCWYNMTGAPSLICPECGHDAGSPTRLHRTRRRRWAVVLAVLTAFCCYYSWLVRVRVVELKEPVVAALQPTSYLLVMLPKDQLVRFVQLYKRLERFGVWPWESELLLLTLDPLLSANGPSSERAIRLLSTAAKTSDRALGRLFDLREFNKPGTRAYPALWAIDRHAGRLRDDQLIAVLHSSMTVPRPYDPRVPDSILLEMSRRNRPAFRGQVAKLAARPADFGTQKAKVNLELLTTLRRMDGKPDPVHVFLDGPQTIECRSGNLPTIIVHTTNVDFDGEAIGFQESLATRSGRHPRWRFEVRDQQGQSMPLIPWRSGLSGTFSFGMLEPGKSYEIKLEMGKYVEPLAPGRYRVVITYHNSATITDMADISRLIVFKSDPFELIVRPGGADSHPAGPATRESK